MNPLDYGDPYIEWEETNSAQESREEEKEEVTVDESIKQLEKDVVTILVAEHDMLPEEAETTVEESMRKDPDMWNENADAEDLANYLASDESDS